MGRVRFLLFTIMMFIMSLFAGCSGLQNEIFNVGLGFERYRSDMVRGEVTADDHSLQYLERKGGGETIVLLHGFGADKENWLRFVRYIPEKYRIIAIDLPGHGESTRSSDAKYDIFSMEKRFSEAIGKIVTGKFHIAGNSMGGLVSILYSSNNPERIITLGLFDSAGIIAPVKSDFFKKLEKGENPLVVKTKEDFSNLMELCFTDEPFLPWPARSVYTQRYIKHRAFNQKMWNELFGKMDDRPVREVLPNLAMPVFILWGDQDRILDVSGAEIFNSYIPNADVSLLKNCGHVPMLERSEESALRYLAFINGNSGN